MNNKYLLRAVQRKRVAKLVAALRGEVVRENGRRYRKGMGRLRDGEKFCCLGVACDLAKRALKLEWDGGVIGGEYSHLPEKVANWYGITQYLTYKDGEDRIEALNDGYTYKPLPFRSIAKLLEQQYLKPVEED